MCVCVCVYVCVSAYNKSMYKKYALSRVQCECYILDRRR